MKYLLNTQEKKVMITFPNKKVLTFDLETTGLTKDAKIVQMSFIMRKNNIILERFTTLVNPLVFISEETSAIHKITNDDVKNAKSITVYLDKIQSLFKEADIIEGYNIIKFDLPLLASNLGFNIKDFCSLFFKSKHTLIIDYYFILRRGALAPLFNAVINYKLTTVYKYFTSKTYTAHDAENDVLAVIKLSEYIFKDIHDYVKFEQSNMFWNYIECYNVVYTKSKICKDGNF